MNSWERLKKLEEHPINITDEEADRIAKALTPTEDEKHVKRLLATNSGIIVLTEMQFSGESWEPTGIYPYLSAMDAICKCIYDVDEDNLSPSSLWDWPKVYPKNLPAPAVMQVVKQHFPFMHDDEWCEKLIQICREESSADAYNCDRNDRVCCKLFEHLSGWPYAWRRQGIDDDLVTFYYPTDGIDVDIQRFITEYIEARNLDYDAYHKRRASWGK